MFSIAVIYVVGGSAALGIFLASAGRYGKDEPTPKPVARYIPKGTRP